MDVREKLVELIAETIELYPSEREELADGLIANGVTVHLWQSKTECTDEAIDSIRDYMVQELLGGFDCRKAVSCEYEWTFTDGRVVELRIAIKQPAE